MYLALAVVRTLFLLFVAGFTARSLPIYWRVPKTFDEQYARCSQALDVLQQAAWFAVGWILLETVVGWILALRSKGAPRPPAAA